MLRIGLLIADLKKEDICDFCVGAIRAAEKEEILLTIMPGGSFLSDEQKEKNNNYDYQQTVIFDYVSEDNFDGLLIDLDSIGANITDYAKDVFLGNFISQKIPFLLLSEFNCNKTINNPWMKHDRNQGYQAILDIENYITAGELPIPGDDHNIPPIDICAADSMKQLSIVAERLLHRLPGTTPIYSQIMELLSLGGVKDAFILVYGDGIPNTLKDPWIMPEKILVKGLLHDGHNVDLPSGTIVDTMNLLDESTEEAMNPGGWLARTLYFHENQNGVMAIKINSNFMVPNFENLLFEIIHTSINSAFRDIIFQNMAEEIMALQVEVERGDSILDRLGEKDYMTGEYNRRGFFTHAYDYMRRDYVEGTYAIISYVDLDTLRSINELYGRQEGNLAIKRTAVVLHNVFGEQALVGRLRGNEFAVLLITNRKDKLEYLRASMQQQNARLMAEQDKPYSIHLMFVINQFEYSSSIRFEDMLKETDINLKNMKNMM